MLMQVGLVQFVIAPLNLEDVSHEGEATYAAKEVLGRRPPLEFMGDGPEQMTLSGKLFPLKWAQYLGETGLDGVNELGRQMGSGIAQLVVRGDGKVYGWYVIEKMSTKATRLDRTGVGQVFDLEITLKRADPPSVDDYTTSLTTATKATVTKRRTTQPTTGPAPGVVPKPATPAGRDPDAFRTDL